jgi:hypothetical protein
MRWRRPKLTTSRSLLATILFCAIALCAEARAHDSESDVRSGPIGTVRREVYVRWPKPGASTSVKRVWYVGRGLRRREIHLTSSKSDIIDWGRERYSDDNGITWTDFTALPGSEDRRQGEGRMEGFPYALRYDPNAKRTIETSYQRIYLGDAEKALGGSLKGKGKSFFDHGMYRLSSDEGRTWTVLRQLRYEEGAEFNPDNWTDPAYLKTNQMTVANDFITLSDQRIACPVWVPVPYEQDEDDRRICAKIPWFDADSGYVLGVMCFFGIWQSDRGDYRWTHSDVITVPRRVSTRGLVEPAIAELKDGRLLLEMRGSNKGLDAKKYPARKWISTSSDGGKTWSSVTDLRYDTGEQFYSPSAFSRLVRAAAGNGKLYWIGNISTEPVSGNEPRYPLYVAEVDEANAALKKHTLTVIDDRRESDTEKLQLSNFYVLENRETKSLEVYLTRYAEQPDLFTANAYKYTLTFND